MPFFHTFIKFNLILEFIAYISYLKFKDYNYLPICFASTKLYLYWKLILDFRNTIHFLLSSSILMYSLEVPI